MKNTKTYPQIKVAHVADLQVKNRATNSNYKQIYIPYKNALSDIASFMRENPDIPFLVIAGDLFEYATPNDSERKLIYNFLSELTTIPTIEKIIIIAGNHDLAKQASTHNPINVFVEMIHALSTEYSDKFMYIDKSGNYPFCILSDTNAATPLVHDGRRPLNIIGYSLEDGITQIEDYDPEAINICIYHGFIKEYANEFNIPLRNDIYESLISVNDFPANSIIMAGDIHKHLVFHGKNNQHLYYPGSMQQHTFGEGQYISIEDNTYTEVIPQDKFINVFTFTSPSPDPDLKTSQIPDYVYYITLELNSFVSANALLEKLRKYFQTNNVKRGINQTYIKVKSSNKFIKYEREIFEIINAAYAPNPQNNGTVYITFEYDKIISEHNVSDNPIISELVSDATTDQEATVALTPENIDSLILTESQVIKLFENVVNDAIIHTAPKDDDININNVRKDIVSLFTDQIRNTSINSKKYSLCFKRVQCNQFMALSENDIDLDIAGITRIIGTNGIGKTTLFRMIRWCLTGFVFENMKQNQTKNNNIIIFNKDLPDNDVVCVKLYLTNADKPVIIQRTCVRKWKNNTSPEDKISINWKDYVSAIERDIRIIINLSQDDQKIITGDAAEDNIKAWIGDAVDNVMFINSAKIEQLLKTSGSELNEMIMQFIGVNYIQKLEDNLESVKEELAFTHKTIHSKAEIQQKIADNNSIIISSTKDLEYFEDQKKTLEEKYAENDNILYDEQNKLINIGNIPNRILEKEQEIASLKDKIKNFVMLPKIQEKLVTMQEPHHDTVLVNRIREKIDEISADNTPITDTLSKAIPNLHLQHEYILACLNEIYQHLETVHESEKDKISALSIELTSTKDKLYIVIEDIVSTVAQEINDQQNMVSELMDNVETIVQEIYKNEQSIKDGICSECKRPYADNFEEMKKQLESTNVSLKNKQLELGTEISEQNKNLIFLREIHQSYIAVRKDINMLFTTDKVRLSHENVSTATLQLIDAIPIHYSGTHLLKDYLNTYISVSKEYVSTNMFHEKTTTIIQDLKLYIATIPEPVVAHLNPLSIDLAAYPEIADTNMIQPIQGYNDALDEYTELCTRISNNNELIKKLVERIDEVNNEYSKANNLYQQHLLEIFEYNKTIAEKNIEIDKQNAVLNTLVSEKESAEADLKVLINQHLPVYNHHQEKLSTIKQMLSEIHNEKDTISQNITASTVVLTNAKNEVYKCEQEYEAILLNESKKYVWQIYSKVIKNNFKDTIFEYYRIFLNNTLSNLLDDLSFKLFWDQQSNLYMLSIVDSNVTYIPVNQCSGMETIFNGLALIYTISLLNITKSLSHIFIDELSGQLSRGDTLSYEANNYQEMFVTILKKFENKSIFIVDHNIENMNEDATYEVSRIGNGSHYTLIHTLKP
jgi:DNA repair exonuclease SbcCD ATPase subunit